MIVRQIVGHVASPAKLAMAPKVEVHDRRFGPAVGPGDEPLRGKSRVSGLPGSPALTKRGLSGSPSSLHPARPHNHLLQADSLT